MKKFLAILVATLMVFSVMSFAAAEDYTIRIYSNSNSTERVTWLINAAKEAGFTISLDTNETISGDTATGALNAVIENNSGSELPSTGGMGTTIFYVVGGLMVVSALVLLITKKRMSR